MSLSFISSINNKSSKYEVESHAEKIWNNNPKTAIKLFFFILDKTKGKNQEDAFVKLMTWLYYKDQQTFFRNLSLIVGRYNSKIKIPDPKEIYKQQWKKHEDTLSNFIEPSHKISFQEYWNHSAKQEYIKNNINIPIYGNWNTLIKISESINDKKIFYTVVNIFTEQILEDNKNKVYSDSLEILKLHPNYMNCSPCKDYINNNKQTKQKQNNEKTFWERYTLVDTL